MAERAWRLAKAGVLRDEGRTADAEAEERLALQGGPADAWSLLAESLLARRRGDRKRALGCLSDSLACIDAPVSVRCRALWWRSVVLQETGEIESALADLHALRIMTADTLFVPVRIASLKRRLGREREAEALLAEVLQDAAERDQEEAWSSLGSLCVNLREFSWAERVAAAGLLRYPDSAGLHHNRGTALDMLGRGEDALAECDRTLEIDPAAPGGHSGRAAALAKLGRLDEALLACGRALELYPSCAATHNIMAYALFHLRRLDAALAACDRALAYDPDYVWARVGRGTVLRELGRIEEALADFDRALELDPTDPMAHTSRGCVLMSLGRNVDALAACDRALELDENYVSAHANRAAALAKLGRPREALEECDRVLGLEQSGPHAVAAHSGRGLALLQLGRPDEAVAACDRAVDHDPKNGLAHGSRAKVLRALGRNAEALQAYENAAELMPRDPRSYNSIAWLRATCPDSTVRDASKAVDFASRAVELAPNDGNYWNTLGVALCRAGRWADSLEALEKSMSLRDGGDAYDWFFAAMAKWHLGNRDDARALYDRAAAWAGEHAPKDEDLRRFRDEAAKLLGVKP